ncbi:MAG: hypothetical protein A2600_03815 [Candidatus Lambdaproteobacteria bacterium RIFOXYD1_FULL_56_27]|uniref:NmrA-like domain-containing protein n=1 Tax=Candidatus Lambdaproteobacteria bacterium RIFOXYD2_FULL_56_26 TaxID=1817773 RepID=A0A1F6H3C5_9PROT|nr:MAG: hypothetical protein A2426_11225 [Candidatus Lambdaproteobacteria bacterium RIFOXYC1_FULL_56_13]OGH04888.1 MAG: hypothetical protein A2557_07880 [Candidatus Lambdaproteobacteria bacterium RIFOXYD2_FULL_56_26]OGH09353.1 MAG: hypothetical protein A2600_03815 [Candidatus Lambdaproteobacteria bacterium RIFOXYD1_FULL_56_27]
MAKILVTGATGPLGGGVAGFLAKKMELKDLAVLVRDPAKAKSWQDRGIEVRQGDYGDLGSLERAFQGVEKLYFVSGNEVEHRTAQQAKVVAAAKKCGLSLVVYTSFQRKNETTTSPLAALSKAHLETERLLRESGLNYTFLRHNLYFDILPMFLGPQVLEQKTIFLPAGAGKGSFVSRKDLAEVGAHLLTGSGHEKKSYNLSNTRSWSFSELAETLSKLSGKQIAYVSPDPQTFKKELAKAGVPQIQIEMAANFSQAILEQEFDSPSPEVKNFLGRAPLSLEEYLKAAYSL